MKSNRFDENIGAPLLNKPGKAGKVISDKSKSLCRSPKDASERTLSVSC